MSHDPGDEDRSEHRDNSCPFCGQRMKWPRVWRTAVMRPMRFEPEFSAAVARAAEEKYEVLDTCSDEKCKRSAAQFSRSQGVDPDYKESQRAYRAMCREAGWLP